MMLTFPTGPLEVLCGNSSSKDNQIVVKLPSEEAKALYAQINNCPPKDPAKFALRLLSVFLSGDELAQSPTALRLRGGHS